MNPIPDYGLDSYKGSGKLIDKVAVITGSFSIAFARFYLVACGLQAVIRVLVERLLLPMLVKERTLSFPI